MRLMYVNRRQNHVCFMRLSIFSVNLLLHSQFLKIIRHFEQILKKETEK